MIYFPKEICFVSKLQASIASVFLKEKTKVFLAPGFKHVGFPRETQVFQAASQTFVFLEKAMFSEAPGFKHVGIPRENCCFPSFRLQKHRFSAGTLSFAKLQASNVLVFKQRFCEIQDSNSHRCLPRGRGLKFLNVRSRPEAPGANLDHVCKEADIA